jgi:hypothetical protein
MADQGLTREQKEIAIKWLNDKTGGHAPKCPFCGSDNWGVSDHLVITPIMGVSGGLILGGPTYPYVTLVSDPCGYTAFFSAVII